MLSEAAYREAIDDVFTGTGASWARGGAEWNNQLIISLAVHGLCLLPIPAEWTKPPFDHYIQAPFPAIEDGVRTPAWKQSWIVDGDWEEHYKPPLKFQFTPLTRTESCK